MIEGLLLSWGATAAWSVFGPVLENLAQDAAKSYVGKCFGSVLSPLNRKPLTKATGLAVKELLKLLEDELLDADLETRELEAMRDVVADFLEQEPVQQAIGSLFLEPGYHLDPALFVKAWQDTPDAPALPEDFSWKRISKRFSRKVEAIREDSAELRETFARLRSAKDSEDWQKGRDLPPEFDLDKYAEALVERFASLSLDSLDTDGAAYNAVRLWNVFVPQSIRECQNYRPQLLELPKEEQQRLIQQGEVDAREFEQLERERHDLRRAYFDQTPRPVLEVCADLQLPRLVILGDPGSGKSSLLRFLALEWARDEDANRRYTAPLPLLIELRDYNQWNCPNGKGFVSYLHHARTWHRLNQQTLDALLKIPGRVVLLLDGLDEIFDPKEREQAINDIHRFSNDYPDTRIILTSRVVGYKAQRLRGAGFQDFMLQDLDEEQIEQFLNLWHETTFTDTNEAERKRERLAKAIKDSRPIKLLAGNPLLLTLMAIINRHEELPRNRVELYEKAAKLLLQNWDTGRHLQNYPDLKARIRFWAKAEILRKVAMEMQTGGKKAANLIQGDKLIVLIADYLKETFGNELLKDHPRSVAEVLVRQLRERNFILCFLGGDSYAFVHRTFLEYFCAAEYVDQFKERQTLKIDDLLALYDQHCRDDDWQEVLRLICGQLDEQFAGRIIAHLTDKVDMEAWNGEIPPPELVLAVWCLSEVKNLKRIEKKVGADLLLKVIDCFLLGQAGYYSGPDDFIDFSEGLSAAAKTVGSEWPGKSTFRFCGQYPDYEFSTYQSEWPFFIAAVFQQREWIENLVRKNLDDRVSYPLAALVKYWPDDKTRQLIIQNIFSDHKGVIIYSNHPSSVALKLLVQEWPDYNTWRLLTELILQDEREWLCCWALELLADHWPDNDTRQLIKKQILVNGAAASLYGKEHSRFGRLVFYDSSTILAFGYLNPRQPIPTEHIQKAAKEANIPPDKIDEAVRSLSKHMGWDITKGSEAGKLP
ncbi:MAG: NACHT domain-containing protein [Candidatus Electrothrix sp. Rat3]|nr:NACHT domain-containing protein [Candidatus Electrothrix rattekaaiensis]